MCNSKIFVGTGGSKDDGSHNQTNRREGTVDPSIRILALSPMPCSFRVGSGHFIKTPTTFDHFNMIVPRTTHARHLVVESSADGLDGVELLTRDEGLQRREPSLLLLFTLVAVVFAACVGIAVTIRVVGAGGLRSVLLGRILFRFGWTFRPTIACRRNGTL